MANETHSLLGVKHGTTEVGGISAHNLERNIEDMIEGAGGAVYPTFGALLSQKPGVTFTSCEIAALIDLAGLFGSAPSASEFMFQRNAQYAQRASNYIKLTPYKTLWVPRRLTANHNQKATIEYYVYCIGDASNKPLAVTTSSGSYVQAIAEAFTLGPQSINGTDFEAQSLSIDFGIQVELTGHSGIDYPTGAYIKTVMPVTTIKTNNLERLATLAPSNNAGLTVTSCISALRKLARGGAARVAEATSEHVKIESTDGVAYFTQAGGEHGASLSMDITIKHVYDGTNAIFQPDTAAALAA